MRRAAIIGVAVAATLGGCGDGERTGASATATATPAATHAASAPRAAKVLYVWRNFEETGIPDELTIYADGRLRYRNLLHTQRGIHAKTSRLGPGELRAIRSLLDRVDVGRADATRFKPRRDGFRWVLRRDGQVGTAADGHLRGPLRPLLHRISALMDRLQTTTL